MSSSEVVVKETKLSLAFFQIRAGDKADAGWLVKACSTLIVPLPLYYIYKKKSCLGLHY